MEAFPLASESRTIGFIYYPPVYEKSPPRRWRSQRRVCCKQVPDRRNDAKPSLELEGLSAAETQNKMPSHIFQGAKPEYARAAQNPHSQLFRSVETAALNLLPSKLQ